MSNIDLSLIVPCYNEESVLADSIKDVFEILDNTRINYETIFVDDCSLDNTRNIIDYIISKYPEKKVTKIFHQKNTGRGGAVTDGIRAASGEVAGFFDIDLEVHARYIPSCFLAVKNGQDIATAKRIYKFYFKSCIRYFMSRGYAFLVRSLLDIKLEDTETGFKFFNREKILPILSDTREKGWFWDTEIMVRAYLKGYRIKEIPCIYMKNFKKPSTVKEVQDTLYYLKKLVKFRSFIKKEKNKKEIRTYWIDTPDIFSDFYREERNIFVRIFLVMRARRLDKMIYVKDGIKAIDVGCGTGVFSKLLLKKGATITAVDYSERMLGICDKELERFGKEKYSLVKCDAASLNLSDNSFGFLISAGLLDYIEDIGMVLKEFHRVIKPHGEIIFTVPKRYSPFFLFRYGFGTHIRRKVFGIPPVISALTKKEIKSFLSETGLALKKIDSFCMTMWIVHCKKP